MSGDYQVRFCEGQQLKYCCLLTTSLRQIDSSNDHGKFLELLVRGKQHPQQLLEQQEFQIFTRDPRPENYFFKLVQADIYADSLNLQANPAASNIFHIDNYLQEA